MFRFVNNHELTAFEATGCKDQHFFANLYIRGLGLLLKKVKSSQQTPKNS